MTSAYIDLLAALHASGVRYAIAGGFAVVLHGVPRMTFDLDLAIDLAADNVERLVATLRERRYRPRLPLDLDELLDASKREEWVAERNLIAFSLVHPERVMEEVDLLLVLPVSWDEIARTTVTMHLEGVPVVVVGRAALRAMKLATGRAKDRIDAELLGEDFDV